MEGLGVRFVAALAVVVCLTANFAILPTSGQTSKVFFRPGVLDRCCMAGMQWSNSSGRCSGYPGPVLGVEDESQSACLSIVEVCCLKQMQLDMCEMGKKTALDRMLCAVRDSETGAEQFRECCQCCQMGVAARLQSAFCEPPGLGEPCDSKFTECCTGRPSTNLTIPPALLGDKSGLTDTAAGGRNEDEDNNQNDNSNSNTNNDDANNNVGGGDAEVDECDMFGDQLCSHICVDLPRGFRCDCPSGFTLNDDKQSCSPPKRNEIDCTLNNPCEHRCTTRVSGVNECVCYDGYTLNEDRRTCTDIDECVQGTYRCSPNQQCINTNGGYTCMVDNCPRGGIRNPRTGLCESGHACLSGFTFNSLTRRCEDIDECVEDPNACYGRLNEVCHNMNGTYACDCQQGFERNRTTHSCEDINECARGLDDCKVGERCENTNGRFTCRRIHHCGTGYTLEESTQSCVDIDECSIGTHNCGLGFVCQNVQGSFRCSPKECPAGSRFDSVTGDCKRIVCRRGMKPSRSGSCVDIDECAEGNHRCRRHQRCVNTAGSYQCRNLVNCPPGYEATSNSGCQDINECTTNTHRCGPDQECVNRQGSYFCQCPRGFSHDASGRCIDVNECAYGAAICPSTSRCVNTVGSFKCECKEGMISDESGGCLDIDECLTDNICQHKCRNVQGSYFCTCNRGYQLRDDKRSCEDVDECTQFRGIGGRGGVCGGRCINTPGSYRCECPDGWRLKRDGRSCEDIDECQENTAFCPQQNSLCINTRGSYKCPVVRCPEGFAKTTSAGPQHSIRCKRVDVDCPECRRGLLSRSYNFLTFPSNVLVPAPLFSMTGARDQDKTYSWRLHLLSARPLLAGVLPAHLGNFKLEESMDQAVVSLATRVDGPQDVELRLDMNITSFYSGFEGMAESRIFLYITDDGSRR